MFPSRSSLLRLLVQPAFSLATRLAKISGTSRRLSPPVMGPSGLTDLERQFTTLGGGESAPPDNHFVGLRSRR